MEKNKRNFTVLLTITLSFIFSGYMALASTIVGKGWYINDAGLRIEHIWKVDDNGVKITEWTLDGRKQKTLDGHVVPEKPPTKSTQPIDVYQLSNSCDIAIYASEGKHYLSVNTENTDEDVSISIVDLSGDTVKQLYVEGNSITIISLEDLVVNKVYNIVLVNKAGIARRITFILNDYQILFDR